MIKAILFDLDGTLLPMDQDHFIKTYLGYLAQWMEPKGYEPRAFLKAIWDGTAAMITNDGSRTNEETFWDVFAARFGEASRKEDPVLEEFYRTDFRKAKAVCGYAPMAAEVVQLVKEKGLLPVLATNPLFPPIATHQRIRWAGLTPEDFSLVTTYQNASHCKPNPAYYQEILETLDLKPEQCLMVGNDTSDDMVAEKLGMQVFLLTDCLINAKELDITQWPNGTFEDLYGFIEKIPPV